MTIKEFLDAYKKERRVIGVLCETDAEVAELSTALDDMGALWQSGARYTEKLESAPVVYYNDGMYSSESHVRRMSIELLSFKPFSITRCPFCGSLDIASFNEERYCLSCGAYGLDSKGWQKKEI